jgi:membrane fusion protein (multidrug efflux system)
MSRGIFRQEALEHHAGRGLEGDILRFDTRWLRWTYRIVLAGIAAALLYIVVFDVNEYASGIAFVRVEGRRVVATPFAGTVEAVFVQPGQHVQKGQLMATMAPNAEDGELRRAATEYSLHLAQLLRDPGDHQAKQSLASLRPRRDQAKQAARGRFMRAPQNGVVTDVRARAGMHVDAKSVIIGVAPLEAEASLVCVLPGDYRPMLKTGTDIRYSLDGFKFEYRSVKVDSVGEEVIGPVEMKRFIGPEIADALPINGPSVLVKGKLPTRTFKADGQTYTFVEGLTAKVDVRVRSEPIILVLLPALKALRPRTS